MGRKVGGQGRSVKAQTAQGTSHPGTFGMPAIRRTICRREMATVARAALLGDRRIDLLRGPQARLEGALHPPPMPRGMLAGEVNGALGRCQFRVLRKRRIVIGEGRPDPGLMLPGEVGSVFGNFARAGEQVIEATDEAGHDGAGRGRRDPACQFSEHIGHKNTPRPLLVPGGMPELRVSLRERQPPAVQAVVLPDTLCILDVNPGDVLVGGGFEGRLLRGREDGIELDLVDDREGNRADEFAAPQFLRGGSVGGRHPVLIPDHFRHRQAGLYTVSERFGEGHGQGIYPCRDLEPRVPSPTEKRGRCLPLADPLIVNDEVLTFLCIEGRRLDAEVVDVTERQIM